MPYVVKCQNGNQRYYVILNRHFACTQQELPRELATAARINPLKMAGYEYHEDEVNAEFAGLDWTREQNNEN